MTGLSETLIPNSWRIVPLKELTNITAGGDYNPATASPIETDRHPFPVYANAIERKAFHSYSSTAKHPEGAVTITARGTLGFSQYRDKPFTAIGRLLVVWPNPKFDGRYLAEYLNSQVEFAIESTGVPQLTGPQAGSYRVLIPEDVAEQSAIAEALSDADALIEGLERLIAKKRLIKQGAMQDLLTAKRRLPGFSGEWVERKLGAILNVRHGRSQKDVESTTGQYPILATGGQIGTASRFLWDKPSVLIGRKGTIDRPQFLEKPFWTVDTLFYTDIYAPNDPRFIFYLFQRVDWQSYNEASGVPSLNAKTIEAIDVTIPSADEQVAISAALKDMDTEIQALETRLDKARQVKEGMMQNLLTGRIRLV